MRPRCPPALRIPQLDPARLTPYAPSQPWPDRTELHGGPYVATDDRNRPGWAREAGQMTDQRSGTGLRPIQATLVVGALGLGALLLAACGSSTNTASAGSGPSGTAASTSPSTTGAPASG